MKLHVATLGLHANQRVIRSIMERGAQKVVLLFTDKNESELPRLLSLFEQSGIPVEKIKTKPWNYDAVLKDILEVVSHHPNAEIEFNGSCGTRIMTAAVYMAAILTQSPVLIVAEDEAGEPKGDLLTISPGQTMKLTPPKMRIIEKLLDEGGSVETQSDLGSRRSLKSGSITKHLQELERAGYIRRKKSGRAKRVTLTDLGRAMFDAKKVRRQRIWRG